uniref:DSBA-like thioredoxin domain-containing protein n=1 Tax=Ditylum brightwellii TaxID=49249 RepID=A0A6V2GUZ4_9STRA|mmetsp:Transcript_5833/g.8869  ORF Transcript_5833/g.8869 Transcript_5833/m.8869 type:complete len:177 (+) Transcript_5833:225-755(+)
MIDPGTNPTGEEFEAYNQRRWGGSGWTRDLKTQGRKIGATFQNWKWWPHTLKAHQLVLYSQDKGVDSHTSNAAIFHALYEDGVNVSLVEELVKIGVHDLGLGEECEEELKMYLEQDYGAEEVKREIERGRRRYDISGVPFFIVEREGGGGGRPYGFSGAQSSSTFCRIFEELYAEE